MTYKGRKANKGCADVGVSTLGTQDSVLLGTVQGTLWNIIVLLRFKEVGVYMH